MRRPASRTQYREVCRQCGLATEMGPISAVAKSVKQGKRLAVNLTNDEYSALVRETNRRGEAVSDLTRDMIQRFLARAGKKSPR